MRAHGANETTDDGLFEILRTRPPKVRGDLGFGERNVRRCGLFKHIHALVHAFLRTIIARPRQKSTQFTQHDGDALRSVFPHRKRINLGKLFGVRKLSLRVLLQQLCMLFLRRREDVLGKFVELGIHVHRYITHKLKQPSRAVSE